MSWNSSFFPFLRVALSNKYFHVGRYDLCCCCFGCILCVYHLYCSCTKTASAVILNSCSAGKSSFGLLWEPEIIFSEWNYFQISDQKWPTLTSYGVLTQPHFGDSAFRPFPLKKNQVTKSALDWIWSCLFYDVAGLTSYSKIPKPFCDSRDDKMQWLCVKIRLGWENHLAMCCSENEPLVDENPATPPTSLLFSAFMKIDNKIIANVNQDDQLEKWSWSWKDSVSWITRWRWRWWL